MYRISRGGYTETGLLWLPMKAFRMGKKKKRDETNSHCILLSKIILCTSACIYHSNKQAVK